MHRLFTDLLRGTLDLVFAPLCVACGGIVSTAAAERGVCVACWARSRPLPVPRCARCWSPLPAATPGAPVRECPECPAIRPAVRTVASAYIHHGPVRPIIHALKYRGWTVLADAMAARMASLPLPRELAEARLVLPVPLAPVKARQRGYNQAALLADAFATRTHRESRSDILIRTRAGGSQTSLHPAQRRANVSRAFQVVADRAGEISAEHLLLLDDVWTTGATALACADVLLEAGARAVSVLTFARALPSLERLERRIGAAAEI